MMALILVLASSIAALVAGALVLFSKTADRLLFSMGVLSLCLCALVLGFGSKKMGLLLSLVFISTDLALYFFARASQLSSSNKILDRKKYFGSRTMILSYSILTAAVLIVGIWKLPTGSWPTSLGSRGTGEGLFFSGHIWSFWFSFVALPVVTIVGAGVSGFLLIRRRGQTE